MLHADWGVTPRVSFHSPQESLRLNNDGITVMTSSYNPYSFSEEGMSKGNEQAYKVCVTISANDLAAVVHS